MRQNQILLKCITLLNYSILLFFMFTGHCYSSEYSAQIKYSGKEIKKYDFEIVSIPIKIKNIGSVKWNSSAEKGSVFLSYHLLSGSGEMLIYDNIRTSFQKEVMPGETVMVNLKLQPPPIGNYIIQVDLVAEGITWFKNRGTKPIDISLNIIKSRENILKPKYNLENFSPKLVWHVEGEREINYCSLLSEKTLKENVKEFKFKNIPVYGFSAGYGYPQIWIRDSATIMPVARYKHSKSELISWIIAHLSIQKQNGELQDWIKANGEFEKNTVESDQESSLVIAAYEISKTIGYDWLLDEVNSRSILLRLSDALNFIFVQRADLHTGLIKSGHTADWGDVSDEFSDQRAVDLYKGSKEVVGIYTNALAVGAATKLSVLFAKTGNDDKAAYWKRKSVNLLNRIQRYLWQENKGFFRIHKHVNFPDHDHFDEGNIFPMGGNAVAIEMGITNPSQVQHIIRQALSRQKLFNFSTISGVLLPSYPKDFFKNPVIDDYFEYQNGGQWDWFGGRLVLQMFLHDDPNAFAKLKEICQKAFLNKGFFEWDTMDGKGQGSSHFVGSAAIIDRMIVEGLFGIDWSDKKIRIRPRLALNQGYIYVPQVENGQFVSYVYKSAVSQSQDKFLINFSFGSNVKYPKTLILPKSHNEYTYSAIKINGNQKLSEKRVTENLVEIDINSDKSEILIEYAKKLT